jgi:hypothetical protein
MTASPYIISKQYPRSFTDGTPLISIIDDTGVGGIMYVCTAKAGIGSAEPYWSIKKITTGTTITTIYYPNGDPSAIYKASLRASYTYS